MSYTMLESGDSSSADKAESRSVWYAASCALALPTSTTPSGFSAFIATTASKAGACCPWFAYCVPSDHGGYCCPAPIIRNCAITSACWLTSRLSESISAICLTVMFVSLSFSVCRWFWATRLFFSTDAPCFRFLGRHESQVSFPAHSELNKTVQQWRIKKAIQWCVVIVEVESETGRRIERPRGAR